MKKDYHKRPNRVTSTKGPYSHLGSVKRPTSAQVMISQFTSSSPTLGSVLTAQSLGPISDSLCPSLSLCPSPACAMSL